MAGFHRVVAAALGLRAEVGRVTEHFRQRDESGDIFHAVSGLHTLDLATAGVEVADDVAHVLFRYNDDNLHQRFHNDGVRLSEGFLDRHRAGDLEGHFRGVDFVVRAVVQLDLDVDNRVTGEDTGLEGALDTGVNRGDIFFRDRAADDRVDELVTLAGLVGGDADLDMAVLALTAGLTGVLVVDVKVTLYDGSYHEVDSSEMAFKIAGSMAFKEGCQKADPTLLEPIMKVCVIVPEEYMGDVIGDLNSRRGQIQGFEARSGAQQIDAFVPLSEMFGYATDLRSRTQGRGQYTMEPSHYVEVPKNIRDKIIDQRNGGRKI